VAHAVSHRSVTAEAQVRLQFSQCEIRGGQSDTGTRFFPSTSVFLRQYHSTNASCSSSSACCLYVKDKRDSWRTFPKQMLFRKSGSIGCKSIFILRVMSWLRWLFTEFEPGPFHVGFVTTKCHWCFPPVTSVLPSQCHSTNALYPSSSQYYSYGKDNGGSLGTCRKRSTFSYIEEHRTEKYINIVFCWVFKCLIQGSH
jgi:hypothetical protein